MMKRAFRLVWVEDAEDASRIHNHMAKCSCSACGNQRHNRWNSDAERLTMQERKQYNALSEQLLDYYDDIA